MESSFTITPFNKYPQCRINQTNQINRLNNLDFLLRNIGDLNLNNIHRQVTFSSNTSSSTPPTPTEKQITTRRLPKTYLLNQTNRTTAATEKHINRIKKSNSTPLIKNSLSSSRSHLYFSKSCPTSPASKSSTIGELIRKYKDGYFNPITFNRRSFLVETWRLKPRTV
jgi:hypothetical protein